MHPARLPVRPLLLALPLLVAACGGSSGGGNNNPPPVNNPPTAAFSAPLNGVLALRGDTVPITVVTNDDGAALVRLLADVDGNILTVGMAEQFVVFGPSIDTNGAAATLGALTTGLTGPYTLFLTVDDGVNPRAVATLAGSFVVVGGAASVPPPRSATYGVQGSRVLLTIGETEDGAVDRNGDGDQGDAVLAKMDAATGLLSLSLVTTDVTGIDITGRARVVVGQAQRFFVATREADGGNLNGDMDATDVLTTVSDMTQLNPVTHVYGGVQPTDRLVGSRCVVTILEAQQGVAGTNLNGDGDATDTIVALLDGATNTRIPFAIAAVSNPVVRSKGTVGAYQISEANQGATDLNGSGAANNTLIVVVDLASPGPGGTITGLGGAVPMANGARDVQPAAAFDVSTDTRLGYYVNEPAVGAPVNGDLDAFDQVPSIWNGSIPIPAASFPGAGAGIALNAGTNPRFALYQGTKFFYTAIEDPLYSPVAGDNGDGTNFNQEILRWTDHAVAAGVTTVLAPNLGGPFAGLTGLALDGGQMARINDTWLAVALAEGANGNVDLSGEGIVSSALLLIDTSTNPPTVWNPGVSPFALGSIPGTGIGDANGMIVPLPESVNGDLNADGDTSDSLLFYISFGAPTVPVNLGNTGGPEALVVGGLVGITANESMTQKDFNLDGDTLDFVFRVLDLTGTPKLAGATCAPTSRPAADSGTLWAYLRSEASEGLLLNADGDMVDFVVAYWRP